MDGHIESHHSNGQNPEVRVRFKYVIISSRSPTLVGRSWNPRQYFTDSSLGNFMHAIRLSHVGASGLLLKLQAPRLLLEETVFDDEDFAEVKMTFNRAIRELKKRLLPSKVASVMMLIEPIYSSSQQRSLWVFDRQHPCEAPSLATGPRRRHSV